MLLSKGSSRENTVSGLLLECGETASLREFNLAPKDTRIVGGDGGLDNQFFQRIRAQ